MKNKETWKKIGILLLNSILFYALLRLLIEVAFRTGQVWIYYAVTILYAAALIGLFIAFFVLNGFTFRKEFRTAEELPEKWDEDQKKRFMEEQPVKKEKAKKLILFILPLIVAIGISLVELYFFS